MTWITTPFGQRVNLATVISYQFRGEGIEAYTSSKNMPTIILKRCTEAQAPTVLAEFDALVNSTEIEAS